MRPPLKLPRDPCHHEKRRYVTEIEAYQVLIGLMRRGREECDYYKCPECGWYHLSSQPRGILADRREARSRWKEHQVR